MTVLAALTALLQSVASDWRPVDILVTSLLTIVTGLVTWILRTVLRHQDDNTEFRMTLWGKDGKNGHSSAIRYLRKAVDELDGTLNEMGHDIKAIKHHVGLSDDSGPRRRSRPRSTDDDAEDDRRG